MNEKYARQSNVDSVRIEKVVVVRSVSGMGTENDPVRPVVEYYDMEGNLLHRIDKWRQEQDERP